MKTHIQNNFLVALLLLITSIATYANPVFPHSKTPPFPAYHYTHNLFFVNEPPVLSATGNQVFCPGSPMNIVTDMTITDPDDTTTDAIYIQISAGYESAQDLLTLIGSHPTIVSSWNITAGKLTLKSPTNIPVSYTDFVAAIKDVVYSNNAAVPAGGARNFSVSVGQANYLPSTGHYYQYVASLGITWSNAKTQAATSTYYGLQGYLATILAADEAQLSGEQAAGAGWIGGSDAETEGVWKWMTGPETGTIFWNGGITGNSPNFAFWNSGEPNNAGDEDYAHVTAPGVGVAGSWNDLSNVGDVSGNYQPKGYIVEYGGSAGDPVLNISTSTTILIPFITATAGDTRCAPGTVVINAYSASVVKWYDSPTGGTLLGTGTPFTTPFLNATTSFYADVYPIGCTTATRTEVVATVIPRPTITFMQPGPICEGTVTIPSTTSAGIIEWYDAPIDGQIVGVGPNFVTPYLTETTTFYVQGFYNECPTFPRIPVTVTVYKRPVVTDETTTKCEGSNIILNAGIDNVTYFWPATQQITKQITVSNPGTYTVEVTSLAPESCTSIKTFAVTDVANPLISTVQVSGSSVTILTSNTGNFEYSVDGINYQTSNVFSLQNAGAYTAHVRQADFCGEDQKDFTIYLIPTFFTPNGDNYNDYWTIRGMINYPKAHVAIFDRYGKLICELSKKNLTWNGTYDGRPLPANDYWFVFKLDDITPEIRGHFSLVR